MNTRSLFVAFALSAVLHGVAGYSWRAVSWDWPAPSSADDPILISCLIPEPQAVPQKRYDFPKRQENKSAPAKQTPAVSPEPNREAVPQTKQLRSKRRASLVFKGMTRRPSKPAQEAPKTAAEFLADPQKGKIYVGYFAVVKDRIHRTLRKRYERKSGGQGTVCLSFVLNADGSLAKAAVIAKDSSADEVLRRFALDCLQASAPFGGFPEKLNSTQIAFTVTIYFDEI